MTLTEQDTKAVIAEQIHKLEQTWNEEVEKSTREKPMDYIRIGEIQGGINALMTLLLLLDRSPQE